MTDLTDVFLSTPAAVVEFRFAFEEGFRAEVSKDDRGSFVRRVEEEDIGSKCSFVAGSR
jgi:hypothetical protein